MFDLPPETLIDSFGRSFPYLRLSITSRCNLNCRYCLPRQQLSRAETEITSAEVSRLLNAFISLGLTKLRVSGGEPTLRADFLDLMEDIHSSFPLLDCFVSTNGYKLSALADAFARLSVKGVNVSVDSLNSSEFLEFTGADILDKVLEGVDKCVHLKIPKIKINAVLYATRWRERLEEFQTWIQSRNISVRFIELMPTMANADLFRVNHMRSAELVSVLKKDGWTELERSSVAGPACEFAHPDFAGRIGVIAPYTENFCSTCNRLRVDSIARLQLCLFAENYIQLRHLLQADNQLEELVATLKSAVKGKLASHMLLEGKVGMLRSFAQIGG